jgi:hypothetical protein
LTFAINDYHLKQGINLSVRIVFVLLMCQKESERALLLTQKNHYLVVSRDLEFINFSIAEAAASTVSNVLTSLLSIIVIWK